MYMRVIGDEICHKQSEARAVLCYGRHRLTRSPYASFTFSSQFTTAPRLPPPQVDNLYELFHTRASLHKRARTCRPSIK